MAKYISILGSTGSIGRQTLEVCKLNNIRVLGISANSNIDLLEKQTREFRPLCVAIADERLEDELKHRLRDFEVDVFSGQKGLEKIAMIPEVELVVSAIVGIAGLMPTYMAIKSGHDVALANKETLVVAGNIIMDEAKKRNIKIIPIDSEHSAIFQCLYGNDKKDVEKIILTASGGPFRGKKYEYLKTVTPDMALKHPNWIMGRKITIDSATLMNKGFEVIEAKWLFDMDVDKIEVVIHPESIIHSMVEYVDGVVMAELGTPDMRVPISHAIMYPDRVKNNFAKLDLLKYNKLTFEKPDMDTFECLKMAYQVSIEGGLMPTVLNAANEFSVDLFLRNKINFTDIQDIIKRSLYEYKNISRVTVEDILHADKEVKDRLRKKYIN
ncbi:MAG: 1-deoxy-D-xylulose-5-phosphate reductoisomerase [Clostridiales bacterium]|nr:1-deoxy-D-xylulose-5-phosphate reductoisomerase [Clostridiales bacterium]